MVFDWFKVREATEFGAALADQFATQTASGSAAHGNQRLARGAQNAALQDLLRRAERETRALQLNVFKRAKLVNSFKWRLLEIGIEKQLADELTAMLVLHVSSAPTSSGSRQNLVTVPKIRSDRGKAQHLLAEGNRCFGAGAYSEAMANYEELLALRPRHPDGRNNLGATLCKLGRYGEAENEFRHAIGNRPNHPEAHSNLGTVLRWKGQFAEAELSLRRALKLKPNYADARSLLGLTLVVRGRLLDARTQFEKALKLAPQHIEALLGMGQVATMEGRFDDAGEIFNRVLEISPNAPGAWAGLVSLRKMTRSDGAWLERAQKIAASKLMPVEEAALRFAIGKYCDDVGDFKRAFHSYKRGNELLKPIAPSYRPDDRTKFVDDLIRVYTRDTTSQASHGASTSNKPIFLVGMPRSGTSLGEQILASHPAVVGAGEIGFWSDALRKHESVIRRGLLGEQIRKQLAEEYLRILAGHSGDALRIIDKTPVNSDYLGVIHSVFPSARIIWMRRNAIDTCLSCYFQQFTQALNFTMDLSELAHYYREHHRLMTHWRAVLPPGTMLELPYEELVVDQEAWTRRVVDFAGLDWNGRCLNFHTTKRPVATASFWQVRQKIYRNSVERWRNYEKFVSPLLGLRELQS